VIRRTLVLLAVAATLAAAVAPSAGALPRIKHFFVITMENKTYEKTFGPQPEAPYLAKTLPKKGAFLQRYYGIGHLSLDNYIAMVSGQPPNPQTQADCMVFNNFMSGGLAPDGVLIGSGCVYPSGSAQTVANQLEGAGYSWRAYAEDMAAKAPAEPASCRHPAINSQDNTQSAEEGDQYATRHVPFLYFHSIIDNPTCQRNTVDLALLPKDLKQVATTPNYSFIVPDLCADGHDAHCADGKSPGGFAAIDKFLKEWVPRITRSPAYQDRGLLLITFDEAGATLGEEDQSACCNEQPGPNSPNPGGIFQGPGGGRVGGVVLSPCTRPGTVTTVPYNHYSQLRWVEDNFALPHLGYAGQPGLKPFGSDILNRPLCGLKVNLSASPKAARAGDQMTFRFTARSPIRTCRRAVEIRFGGKIAHTNGNGKATIRRRFARPGTRVARATKKDCAPDSAKVRVLP
jgi:phosphatidylinositol-3-phosphatase